MSGLYPNYLNPRSGKFCLKHVSVGALGDSFYEYMCVNSVTYTPAAQRRHTCSNFRFKHWLITGKNETRLKETYDAAISAIERQLLRQSTPNNVTRYDSTLNYNGMVTFQLWYFAEMKSSRLEHKMARIRTLSILIIPILTADFRTTWHASSQGYLHCSRSTKRTRRGRLIIWSWLRKLPIPATNPT